MLTLGIDVGATKINVGIVSDGDGGVRIVASERIAVEDVTDLPVTLRAAAERLCRRSGVEYSSLCGCGIGIPGTVSEDGKRIIKAPNIPILGENTALEVERALGLPTLMLQDSRAAVWGEYLRGGGKGLSTVVCITLGTGIGTGIVIDGKIYNGALGAAGELGHIPLVPDGRPCGCGKRGCMEKYCAGGGLDITAAELLGKGKRASDLFFEAYSGNASAKKAINEAVEALGNALISAVNLLSPDCVLFSGGLSERAEFLEPLIAYIRERCYVGTALPRLEKAVLGEYSPLIGAALASRKVAALPSRANEPPVISASVMCADVLCMGEALRELEVSGIEYVHCDIMDNHFVPNMMLAPELLNKMRRATSLPFDFHLMTEEPERVIGMLKLREGDTVSVHYESTPHLHRAVSMIKAASAQAAVAINPATPIETLSEILPEIDTVLIMTVDPGFAGQKLCEGALDKIRRMRAMLDGRGLGRVRIQVDGNCSFENIPKMKASGADIFVVGTSSVFCGSCTVAEAVKRIKNSI